jgi:hypothetical protein
MRFFDRFTRDDVSAKVWWPFTMLLLVLLVLTFAGEHRALDARRRAAAEADAALGARVIEPNLGSASTGTITGGASDQLAEEIHDEILVNDGRIEAVRLWSPSHELVWSSIPNERLGISTALNDDALETAVRAAGAPTWVITDRTPDNAPSPTLFYAYAAQGPQPLVAEFEYLDSELTSDVRSAWLGYQIVFALGFLLSLSFAFMSMREPRARIGTGVPFYPESLPTDLSVVDSDRAIVIEHTAARIRERVGALQNALDESETARRRVEGQLQQALAALNTPGHRMPVPAPDVSPAPDVAPAPVVRVPEPEVAPPEPILAPREPAPVATAEPAAEVAPPTVTPEAEPEPAPKPRPKQKPPPEPEVEAPEPEPEPVVAAPEPEPEPVVAVPEPVIVPEPVVIAPEPDVTPAPEPEPSVAASSDRVGWPEVVVVPELEPAKSVAAPDEESAADMLDRLVEPVGQHDPSEDASDLRARLARTAAIKKPGSKERRELDEQQHRD